MTLKKINVPIFEVELLVTNEMEKLKKYVEKDTEEDISVILEMVEEEYHGFVYMYHSNKDKKVMILYCRDSDMNTIAHECLHASWHILGSCDVVCTLEEHETMAYLHGWLVEKVVEVLIK